MVIRTEDSLPLKEACSQRGILCLCLYFTLLKCFVYMLCMVLCSVTCQFCDYCFIVFTVCLERTKLQINQLKETTVSVCALRGSYSENSHCSSTQWTPNSRQVQRTWPAARSYSSSLPERSPKPSAPSPLLSPLTHTHRRYTGDLNVLRSKPWRTWTLKSLTFIWEEGFEDSVECAVNVLDI